MDKDIGIDTLLSSKMKQFVDTFSNKMNLRIITLNDQQLASTLPPKVNIFISSM